MNYAQKPFTFLSLLLILITTACEKKIDKTKPQDLGPISYTGDLISKRFCVNRTNNHIRISPTEINDDWEGSYSFPEEYSVPQFGPFTFNIKNPYDHDECIKCPNEDSVKVQLGLFNGLPINMKKGLKIILETKTKSDSSFQFFHHTLQTNLDSIQGFDTTFVVENMPDIKEAHLTLKNYQTDGSGSNVIDWTEYLNRGISFNMNFFTINEIQQPLFVKQVNCTSIDSSNLQVLSERMQKDKSYNGYLYFYVENSYPFNFEISTYAVDASGNVINELIDRQSPAKISAADIDPNTGAIQSTTEKKIEIRVTEQTAKDIINAKNIVNELHFNTKGVKTNKDGYISIPGYFLLPEESRLATIFSSIEIQIVEDLRAEE